jgi:hypothetical protein
MNRPQHEARPKNNAVSLLSSQHLIYYSPFLATSYILFRSLFIVIVDFLVVLNLYLIIKQIMLKYIINFLK